MLQNDSKNSCIELSHLGLLQIKGPDAEKFLQGQLTCNLAEISATTSRLGAHCNPQGRMISLFRLFYFAEAYYLSMPRTLIALALKALQKYAVFFKLTLADVSDQFSQWGYAGASLASLPTAVDMQLTTAEHVIICLACDPYRYQFIGPLKSTPPWAMTTLDLPNAWKVLDINQGLAAIYPETSEKFLPQEINLPALNGVSFQKGCYTGQEIIARLHYRGKLKTQLLQTSLVTSAEIDYGTDIILADNRQATVVDYAQIGYDTYNLLVITSL